MISPYILARLNAAAEVADVAAIEGARTSSVYAWEPMSGGERFERHTLFYDTAVEEVPAHEISLRTNQVLDRYAPDVVVVGGWSFAESLAMLRWAAVRNVPAVVMSETTAIDDVRVWWRERVKRFILKFCSAALVGGAPQARYLQNLGMSKERIFLGYDAVDNAYFREQAAIVRADGDRLRTRYGLPPRFFLVCCRFIAVKNLRRLIDAYVIYRHRAGTAAWGLVLLGDGPERAALEEQARASGMQEHIHFHGFRQYGELPVYYGLADTFVHVSTVEPWGLVVNEALASGLPVIVSRRCGSAEDLVSDGVDGFLVDPYDVEQIAEKMNTMASGAVDRAAMGRAGREIVEHWGPQRFAAGLAQAIQVARERPVRPANSAERCLLRLVGCRSDHARGL